LPNLLVLYYFTHWSRTEAPFLHQHYPASSVLRASPPPQDARTVPHGRPVDLPLITPRGFPCCVRFPCVHAVTTTPAQRLGSLMLNHPVVSAFPEMAIGSACATSFSRLAQCLLTLRPAHSRCHHIRGTLHRRLQPLRCLHSCSGCFRLEQIAGWDFHPLGKRRLNTAHANGGH